MGGNKVGSENISKQETFGYQNLFSEQYKGAVECGK